MSRLDQPLTPFMGMAIWSVFAVYFVLIVRLIDPSVSGWLLVFGAFALWSVLSLCHRVPWLKPFTGIATAPARWFLYLVALSPNPLRVVLLLLALGGFWIVFNEIERRNPVTEAAQVETLNETWK